MHFLIISKFQEHLIKSEGVIVMTKSSRGFFSSQMEVTSRLMIRSGQFFNSYEMSTLWAVS